MLRGTKMTNTIIHDIRELRNKHRDQAKCEEQGKFICLDANAEARLAAYIIDKASNNRLKTTKDDNLATIKNVLENGIRYNAFKIFGMELRFDCETFCIIGNPETHSFGNIYDPPV